MALEIQGTKCNMFYHLSSSSSKAHKNDQLLVKYVFVAHFQNSFLQWFAEGRSLCLGFRLKDSLFRAWDSAQFATRCWRLATFSWLNDPVRHCLCCWSFEFQTTWMYTRTRNSCLINIISLCSGFCTQGRDSVHFSRFWFLSTVFVKKKVTQWHNLL